MLLVFSSRLEWTKHFVRFDYVLLGQKESCLRHSHYSSRRIVRRCVVEKQAKWMTSMNELCTSVCAQIQTYYIKKSREREEKRKKKHWEQVEHTGIDVCLLLASVYQTWVMLLSCHGLVDVQVQQSIIDRRIYVHSVSRMVMFSSKEKTIMVRWTFVSFLSYQSIDQLHMTIRQAIELEHQESFNCEIIQVKYFSNVCWPIDDAVVRCI
jgi:hypothetical protein